MPSLATPLTAPALAVKGVTFTGARSRLHPISPSSSSSSEKSKSERSSVLTLETEFHHRFLQFRCCSRFPNHLHLKAETPPLRNTRENFHTEFTCIFCVEQLSCDKRKQHSNPFSDWSRGSSNKRTTITILLIG